MEDERNLPSIAASQGAGLISSVLLVQSIFTFTGIFILSVGFFIVKGIVFTQRQNRTAKYQQESEEIKKEDLIIDGIRNPSQFVYESFGYNKYMTIALYIYRVMTFAWIVTTLSIYPSLRPNLYENLYLKNSTFFTHHMVMVFTTYFSLQTGLGFIYLIFFRNFSITFSSETNFLLKRFVKFDKWISIGWRGFSILLWIIGELNLVAALVVSLGYWIGRASVQEDVLDYVTVSYHGITGILSFIDFILSNFQIRKWHIITLMCFPSLYYIWFLISMKSRWVSKFPYGIVNYYLNPWWTSLLFLVIVYLVIGIMFLLLCFVSYLRNRILIKYFMRKEKNTTNMQTDESSPTCEISISVTTC